jgi:hypothetical protein
VTLKDIEALDAAGLHRLELCKHWLRLALAEMTRRVTKPGRALR